MLSAAVRDAAERRLGSLGFSVSYARHADAADRFGIAPVDLRVRDLHEAYADPAVDGILTAIGGAGCVDVLPHLDWRLLRDNPKPLCGFSDATALLNAVTHRAGTVAYCGPHFSSFAMPDPDRFQTDAFLAALTSGGFEVRPSAHWSDDAWYLRPGRARTLRRGAGWTVLSGGSARGRLVGGNLTTFGLIQGTAFSPPLAGSVLLAEDTAAVSAAQFRNRLAALALQPGAEQLRGLVIGRFQRGSGMSRRLLTGMLSSLPEVFRAIPVIADVDCGHTQPIATFALGAVVTVQAGADPSMTFERSSG